MPALVFDTCCGCIELRTGCLIIGYLQLVGEIILGIILLILLAAGGLVASGAAHAEISSMDKNDLPQEFQVNEKALGAVLIVISVILLLALALALAFTITLLVGIHKEKRGHVKAYLIYTTIFLVLGVILFFVSLSSKHDAGSIVSNLFSLALNIYFLLVVRSYYHRMDTNKPAVFNTA